MIVYTDIDIFESTADVLVNPVNTVGVMGAGLALQFKKRFPEIVAEYINDCKSGRLYVGYPKFYRTATKTLVLCFPTKAHYKDPSKLEWIESGLMRVSRWFGFEKTSTNKLVYSFPMLGCGFGGLRWNDQVKPLMEKHLHCVETQINIHVPEIK